jgi:hypothetical protein
MCGNRIALQALRRAGATVTAVDARSADPPGPDRDQRLADDPQVFVKGDSSAADIVEELEASGELGETLRTKLGDDFAGVGDERTVALA